jgi:hypothetical protein
VALDVRSKYQRHTFLALLEKVEDELLSLDGNGVDVDHETFVIVDLLKERTAEDEKPPV